MIKPELVKVGDVLWDCHRTRMGNTTMTRMGAWDVRVVDIGNQDKPVAERTWTVRWNSNPETQYSYRRMRGLRRTKHKDAR